MRLFRDVIFLFLFFVFLVVGLLIWGAFHLAGGGHLLVVLAVIFLIVHFVRRRHAV